MTFLRSLLFCVKLAEEKALSPCSAASASASPFGSSSVGSKRLRACAVPNDDGERAAACNDAKTYPQAVGTSRLGAMLEVAL